MIIRPNPVWGSAFDLDRDDLSPSSSFDVALAAAMDAPESSPTLHKSTSEAGQQITRDNLHWGPTLGAAAGPIFSGSRGRGSFTGWTAPYAPDRGRSSEDTARYHTQRMPPSFSYLGNECRLPRERQKP